MKSNKKENKMRFSGVLYIFLSSFLGLGRSQQQENSRSVIIGDSMYKSGMPFFSGYPSPLAKWLETWAGHSIENNALVGASLESGWVKSIRQQFESLSYSKPLTTIVMDGGGNDVMSHKSDCLKFNEACQQMLQNCQQIAQSIITDARTKGVQNILYLGFYGLEGLEESAKRGNQLISEVCREKEKCYFVNPLYNATTGKGLKVPEMLGSDKLHPNEEGYELLAEMLWNVTVKEGIKL